MLMRESRLDEGELTWPARLDAALAPEMPLVGETLAKRVANAVSQSPRVIHMFVSEGVGSGG
jgi:hypothetical protein